MIFKKYINKYDRTIFNVVSYSFIILVSIVCIIPFIMVISGSFTSQDYVFSHGYSIIPIKFSLKAYSIILRDPYEILRAYGVSISITVTGTIAGLFLTAMTAYVLYRRDFRFRNQFAFFFYFTTLFSGGLVSYYIIMNDYYHARNNILALIIPGLLSPFYIIIMRNYLKSIPDSITESAKIDGAGDFTIFNKLIIPLMKPALASIGMFIALGYWNDWFSAMLFIENDKLFPLQYLLYKMLTSFQFLSTMNGMLHIPASDIPNETIKLAMTVVAVGPMIFVYPFIQKYFIKGVTIGAVKG